jgi:ABC-type amino acid transport substrate-binding protein
MGSWSWLVACVALIGMSSAAAAGTDRIGAIRARGSLHCGIWPYVPGFAIEHDGRYVGFDVDICRAIAASILGDANKAMRAADTELVQVVRWTIFALIEAEELRLSSHNIDLIESSPSRVRAFLKVHPDSRVGPGAGDWVRSIIAGVGNYGEVFDRNLGADSSIKLDRGLNRLWTQGGLMYAPPLDR